MLKRTDSKVGAIASTTSDYRADIEGLRAVAILSVVIYHLDARFLPGGFTGVDVFFVISGFLITGILLREYQKTGGIDLLNFWSRRARRILPSAFLVLAITTLLTLLFMSPLLLKHTGRDITAAGYFGLNWRSAGRGVDYSQPGVDLSPVIHYWSLAVEEQFYLAWPLILTAIFFCARKLGAKPVFMLAGVAGIILIASLAYCLYLAPLNQPLAFFGTFTRAWQLLAGGLTAIFLAHGAVRNKLVAQIGGPLGLLAIFAGFALIVPDKVYPNPLALLPIAGAVLLILAGSVPDTSNMAGRILSTSPMTYIGRVSYVWYLWHWPIFYFAHVIFPDAGLWILALALAISFGLSVLTHYAFENPVRFHPWLVKSKLRSLGMGLALVAITVLAGLGVEQYSRRITVTLNDGSHVRIDDLANNKSPAYKNDCHISQIETKSEPCIFGTPGAKPQVLLMGDSHAAHFFGALEGATSNRGTAFLMRSKSGCPALDGHTWNPKFKRIYYECEQWRKSVLDTVGEYRPKLVILSNLTGYAPLDDNGENLATGEEDRQRLYIEALRRMITQMLQYADRIVIVADTPRLPEDPAECLYHNPGREEACAWPIDKITTKAFIAPMLADLSDHVTVLDLGPEICPNGLCRAFRDGKPVYYDEGHLAASFSKTLAGTFEKVLEASGL